MDAGTGSIAPKPSGSSISLLEAHVAFLFVLIARQPDLTLDEIVAPQCSLRIVEKRSLNRRAAAAQVLPWRRRRPSAHFKRRPEPHGRVRPEHLVGDRVGPASGKPWTRPPSPLGAR